MRYFYKFIFLFFCILATSNCKSETKTLKLLSWEGYHPQGIIGNFEKEYNAKVDYKYITSIDELKTKLAEDQ